MRRPLALISLFLAINLSFFLAGGAEASATLLSEIRVGRYVSRTFFDEDDWQGSIEVFRDNERVYFERVWAKALFVSVPLGYERGGDESDRVQPKDITGDGEPDLVVVLWTGGAHGWWGYRVFSLGQQFRKIAAFEPTDNGMNFDDVDGDGVYEAIVGEDTFDYWHAPHSDSPVPVVLLRYNNGAYDFAPELMRKRPPSLAEFDARLKEVRTQMDEWVPGKVVEPPSALWRYMLELIYTGNGDLAWRFFDEVWNDSKQGKGEFLAEFKGQLTTGPYWPDIKRLNNWK